MALNAGFTGPIRDAARGMETEKMMRRYPAVTDQTLRAAAEAVSGSSRTQTKDSLRLEVETLETQRAPTGTRRPWYPFEGRALGVPPPARAGAETR